MYDFLAQWVDWIRALHIISVIFWMGGMMYLPRLFIHHYASEIGGELDKLLIIQEHKVLRFIIDPFMILAFICGGFMVVLRLDELEHFSWLWLKLIVVTILAAYHGELARYRRKFARGERAYSKNYYRMIKEFPVVLVILATILAVVEPF
jgi:putative membrane protein